MKASMIRTAVYGIALTALAVPSPTPAQPAVVPAPIAVESCTVLQAQDTDVHPFWFPWGPTIHNLPYADGLEIDYTNISPKVANRIAFLVDYRGDRERVIDVGTFSPNAPIKHQFGTFSGDAFTGARPNICVPIAVRFVDGTVWRAAPRPGAP